jgi:hypothetical protein
MKIEYELSDTFKTFKNIEGKDCTLDLTDLMLAILLIESNLFLSTVICKEEFEDEDRPLEKTTGIYVNANDVFAWGCADAEPITTQEIKELFTMWYHDRAWGCIKWLCRKRNKTPQQPIIDDMKKEGKWCEIMESLPE